MPDNRTRNEPNAIVVTGVSGSGKTTVALGLAGHYGYEFLDADDFHSDEARTQMKAGVALTDAQREPWVVSLANELERQAAQGKSTVLAFSGLRAAHRQRLRESGVPMRFVFLHAAPAAIAARLAARTDHFMSATLLASQFEALQIPAFEPDVVAVRTDGSPAQVLARVVAALDRRAGSER